MEDQLDDDPTVEFESNIQLRIFTEKENLPNRDPTVYLELKELPIKDSKVDLEIRRSFFP